MTQEINYEYWILKLIKENQCLRARVLPIEIMAKVDPVMFEVREYESILVYLIEKGDIIPLYFTTDRTGTLYFPKGTSFSFNGNKI